MEEGGRREEGRGSRQIKSAGHEGEEEEEEEEELLRTHRLTLCKLF